MSKTRNIYRAPGFTEAEAERIRAAADARPEMPAEVEALSRREGMLKRWQGEQLGNVPAE